jgi:hypothetical protein
MLAVLSPTSVRSENVRNECVVGDNGTILESTSGFR